MAVKILLDLPALERLLGGDSEAEVTIRNAVAQAFAKRHLKGLLTKDVIDKIVKDVNNEVVRLKQTIMAELLQGHLRNSFDSNIKMTPEGRELLKKQIMYDIQDELLISGNALFDKAVAESIAKIRQETAQHVLKIEREFTLNSETIEKMIDVRVQARLEKMLSK